MLAPDHTLSEFTLPELDVRALARRAVIPALLGAGAVAAALLVGGHLHVVSDVLRRGSGVSPGWVAAAAAFECVSLAGYVALLSLVAGRATARVRTRESAQITLAGAAATRLLPTAGAGGAALTLWTLRRAGLRPRAATRTLLSFLVLLYSVFLGSIVVAGAAPALGLVHTHGPAALSAIPAVAAMLGIGVALAVAFGARRRSELAADGLDDRDGAPRRSRVRTSAWLLGDAVRDACRLVRTGDPRLAGAIIYWAFDAAVVWSMLLAFGSPPALPLLALAYFVGQVANTLPIPGSVSAGITGVLIAFGVPVAVAVPAVLAYRTIAVWLPLPVAIAAVPGLRATVARWRREDARASAPTR